MTSAPPAPITIRRCHEADLTVVAALYRAWEAEDITWGLRADDEGALREKLGPFFLVAEVEVERTRDADRRPPSIGFVTAQIRHAAPGEVAVFPAGAAYLEVEDLYVTTAWRDAGVGTHLMEHLFEAARAQGVESSLVFSATKDLARIVRFYERFGYQPWGVQFFKQ
ncbi:MAG TPA: GNAT family N-acetyltransferase [Chloroflexota bacterium]|nr:GNAT family N-acetyltransferase [Chloroflexota bacterium]